MWWCREVQCRKNHSPTSGNVEYYTTAPQYETLHSSTLCLFAYFVTSRVRRRLFFLPSIEYRRNTEVECYHSYNNCYILITRTVSLLSPIATLTVSQVTSSSQAWYCKGLSISHSNTATVVRLIRLIMLPH